jgi:tricorn protease
LGLGKVLGVRTWGGEIWLSSSNVLADQGIATAAEMGVYGPERKWLIEGHGVDPDPGMVVDNPPHATFEGQDAQLDAALRYIAAQIKEHPQPVPAPPLYPNKSFPPKGSY